MYRNQNLFNAFIILFILNPLTIYSADYNTAIMLCDNIKNDIIPQISQIANKNNDSILSVDLLKLEFQNDKTISVCKEMKNDKLCESELIILKDELYKIKDYLLETYNNNHLEREGSVQNEYISNSNKNQKYVQNKPLEKNTSQYKKRLGQIHNNENESSIENLENKENDNLSVLKNNNVYSINEEQNNNESKKSKLSTFISNNKILVISIAIILEVLFLMIIYKLFKNKNKSKIMDKLLSLASNCKDKFENFYGYIVFLLKSNYYKDNLSEKIVHSILDLNIVNPFTDNNDIIKMADLLSSFNNLNDESIISILNDFGISFPALDNKTTCYSRLNEILRFSIIYNKEFYRIFYNGKVYIVDCNNIDNLIFFSKIPSLLSISNFKSLSLLGSNSNIENIMNSSYKSFFMRSLYDDGYKYIYDDKSDKLYVEKKYFVENNIKYTFNSMYPNYYEIDIKFYKNSKYDAVDDVIVPTIFLGEALKYSYDSSNIIKDNYIEKFEVKVATKCLDKINQFKTFINDSIKINDLLSDESVVSMLSDKVTVDYLNGLDYDLIANNVDNILCELDSSLIHESSPFPITGMIIATCLSAQKNYRRFNNNEISGIDAIQNISRDVIKKGILGTTTAIASSAAFSITGLSVSTTVSNISGAVVSGGISSINSEDLKNLGMELAIIIGIWWGAKKLCNMIVGNPLDNYKNLHSQRTQCSIELYNYIENNIDLVIRTVTPKEYYNEQKKIDNLKKYRNSILSHKTKSFDYFLNEYCINIRQAACNLYGGTKITIESFLDRASETIKLINEPQNFSNKYPSLSLLRKFYDSKFINDDTYNNLRDTINNINRNKEGLKSIFESILSSDVEHIIPLFEEISCVDVEPYKDRLQKLNKQIAEERDILIRKGHIKT